jgi:preprotein translocase subunit Sss1
MSIWFRNLFRDSERAQETLLGFALALGVIGFLIVVGASLVGR